MSEQSTLDDIRQRLAAVTRPPWSASSITGNVYGDERPAQNAPGTEETWIAEVGGDENREFIAHAPADIDWLIGEVERLRGRLREIEWVRGGFCPACDGVKPDAAGAGHDPGCWLAEEIHPAGSRG